MRKERSIEYDQKKGQYNNERRWHATNPVMSLEPKTRNDLFFVW